MALQQKKLDIADAAFEITEAEILNLGSVPEENSLLIGQERAVKALVMGTGMRNKGYNVFVTGLPGTGRTSAVIGILKKCADVPGRKDIAFVNNFRRPDQPRVLYFEPGAGSKFKKRVDSFIERLSSSAERGSLRETSDLQAELSGIRLGFPEARVEVFLKELEEDLSSALPGDRLSLQSRCGVNLIVDHGDSVAAPVVFESYPDYAAIFGSQEHGPGHSPDFMGLRAGALLRASGGYLILRAEDILNDEDAWNSLKRALQNGCTEIRPLPNPPYPVPGMIRPEPVNIDTKVIILGSEHVYDYLYATDEDFPNLFKVAAEFDSVMDRDEKGSREYAGFCRKIVSEEDLLPLSESGIAGILEHGVRIAEFRNKLTTRMSLIADALREADYWARRNGQDQIDRNAVEAGLLERRFRHCLQEEKIDEQILSGEILISLTGEAVGRINGLAILDRGYYSFARPIVISARTSPGHDGIINIERESGLSGEFHDKGVLIIEGYLQSLYARNFPLSLRASICFEQSYIEIDGDSASSAEIYALLSSIGDIPLRQDLAVTGSVSQMGDIQPVGGVSEKIEGFYEICRKTRLTGHQGVVIPRLNIPNLILSKSVQKALRNGEFHLYAISNVDEGIEILTGIPAGVRTSKGSFPSGTINGRVERRLKEMALQVKDFGGN